MRPGLRRCCAAFLLSVLLAAYAGQKVHIYNEDPAHFAAFSGIVDDFHFFPYLLEIPYAHQFYAEVLAVLLPEATRCKCAPEISFFSLRAPPAA